MKEGMKRAPTNGTKGHHKYDADFEFVLLYLENMTSFFCIYIYVSSLQLETYIPL